MVGEGLLPEVIGMLRAVTGEDEAWAAQITAQTRLEDDLRIESVEVTALAALMRDRADLLAYLAGLDIDQLIALTVGDLAAFLADPARGGRA